jgi:hypothetical protein
LRNGPRGRREAVTGGPAKPGRQELIRQNGYVVEDIDAAAHDWSARLGIGPFFCIRHMALDHVHYRGRPAHLDISVALCFDGELCIELIEQHNDAPSAYRDVVPAGKRGFHHVLVYPQDYDGELMRYQAMGVAAAGGGAISSGEVRFVYLDTRATLGCMLEFVSRDAPAQWMPMKQAARDWRPGDPVIREIGRLGA